jgi:hypothetical protein
MAKSPTPQLQHTPHNRIGEGVMIDVTHHPIVGVGGQTGVAVSINLENAPVPDRRFVVDVASIQYSNETVKLLFGQQKVSSSELRALLIIQMSPTAARQLIEAIGKMKPPLSEVFQKHGFVKEELADITEEPDQTVALAASMVAIAFTGRDACMDFYHISSFSMARVAASKAKNKQIGVEPVVRLDIRTSVVAALYEKLCNLQSRFPEDAIMEDTA